MLSKPNKITPIPTALKIKFFLWPRNHDCDYDYEWTIPALLTLLWFMWFCILASHLCSEKVNYAWLDFILSFPNIPFASVYGAICWESSTLNDLTKFAALAQPRFWRENESPHSQGFSPEGSNPRKNLVEHRGWMRRDQRSGLALPRHNAFGEICLK